MTDGVSGRFAILQLALILASESALCRPAAKMSEVERKKLRVASR